MKSELAVIAATLLLMTGGQVPPQPQAPQQQKSEVRLRGAVQYGTAGVYVRVFHYVDVNNGSDITYVNDPTEGDSLRINTDGVYAVSYTASSPYADVMGVSISQSPTAYLMQLAQDSVACRATIVVPRAIVSCSAVLALKAGDVVKAHRQLGGTQGCNCDANAEERLIIIKVS